MLTSRKCEKLSMMMDQRLKEGMPALRQDMDWLKVASSWMSRKILEPPKKVKLFFRKVLGSELWIF
jgi:hypothetical protein